MKNTIVVILLIISHSLFAQRSNLSSEKNTYSFKLHTLVSADISGVWDMELTPFLPGFMIRTPKGHLHQIELLRLGGKTLDRQAPVKRDGLSLALRYEYALPILQKEDAPVRTFLGMGLMNSYTSWIYEPPINAEAPQRYTGNLTRLSLVPSIQYPLNERVFLDLALPIGFFDLQFSENLQQQSGFPRELLVDKSNEAEFYLLKDIGMRFGLGVQF